MTDFVLKENPAYAGVTPSKLGPACHDGTPFLTIECRCGTSQHIHEAQVRFVPTDVEVTTDCPGCGEPLMFQAGFFPNAFQRMRDAGWIPT